MSKLALDSGSGSLLLKILDVSIDTLLVFAAVEDDQVQSEEHDTISDDGASDIEEISVSGISSFSLFEDL